MYISEVKQIIKNLTREEYSYLGWKYFKRILDSRKLNDLLEGDMGETYGFNMRHFGENI